MPEDKQLIDENVRDELKRDFARSYLVDAGAGAGKTTVLVNRLIGAIEAGYDLKKVAAVTFTEKAAGELILRVRQKIEENINDSSESGKWKDARESLERAHIGTIHSFCASLLRERPIEAGIDPNFEVADDYKSRRLREDAWKEWLERQLDFNNEWEWLVRTLLKEGVTLKKVRKTAFKFVEKREVLQAYFNESPSRPQLPELDVLKRKVTSFMGDAKQLAEEYCKKPDDDNGVKALKSQEKALNEFNPEPDEQVVFFPLEIKGSKGNRNNWKPKDKKNEFAEILTEIEGLINEYNNRIKDCLAHSATMWLHNFIERYQQTKAEEGCLDFEDLLIKSRDLLLQKDVRADFQKLFDLILVDEFQDTDPLQIQVALLLSEAEPKAENWYEVKPTDGKLFIVGDPKQSIYRFRRADIHTYLQVKTFSGKVLTQRELAQNFRSAGPLMEFFNSFFDEHFNSNPQNSGGIDYKKLEPPPEYSPPPAKQVKPGVVGLKIAGLDCSEKNGPKVDVIRPMESGRVARFIKQIVDGEWQVRDKNGWRDVNYGDIAVLFRKRTGLHYFSEALRKLGVPYVAPGAAGLFSQPESRSLLSCLMAIDRPDDGVALVGALRSPFFGFTDESIAMARFNGLKLHYLLEPDSEKFPQMAQAFDILRNLHLQRNETSKAQLISKLLEETGALALYSDKKRGLSGMATISRFQQLARDFDYSAGGGLRSFIDYLVELESESQAEEAPVETEESNDVSLMTIHGAKGLEFPVVILGDMTVDDKNNESVIINRRESSVSVKIGDNVISGNWEEQKDNENKESQQEEARLLYVACTRARDYLVVPMPEEGDTGKFTSPAIRHIREKWEDKTFFPEPDTLEAEPPPEAGEYSSKAPVEMEPGGIASLQEWEAHREDIKDKLSRQSRFKTVTGQESEMASIEGSPDSPDPSYGRNLGIFVHRLMEKMDISKNPDIKAIKELAERLGEDADLPSGQLQAAVEMAMRATELSVVKRAMSAGKLKKEFPVMVKSDGDEMISGVVDLVFEENGKLALADYKTDAVNDKKEAQKLMKHKYARQGRDYARALEKATGMEVSEAFILFLHPSPAIELACYD